MQTLSLETPVRTIASELPGAAELFRRSAVNFCCSGDIPLREAAERVGLSPADMLAELEALQRAADREAPQETEPLIDHLLSRYHDTHRRELAFLIPLAQKVERVHGDHPVAPSGLARALVALQDELEDHMTSEEQILFPLMRRGQSTRISQPIAQMRHEHADTARLLQDIEHAAHGMALPAGACGSWTALYTGLRKLTDDIVLHMHLENAVLFPRFENPVAIKD
ncbi:iron-sulfur cluster repair di-iron protein [Sinorhizobium sp. BG8]|uniref:iron-sulfur cluster repair di-iron protein n=1 Tax=Sinorhizobium sp. BG8 TaxID=2613773 RepID=UPI00193E4C6A|nr:iron-sulfur cluster repair di-iron protein [Sinorhizobium sp. BG8]QRM57166.1 iron-sulfur cluster repair di-iron protein [Sinorhizobium sp. BG8]